MKNERHLRVELHVIVDGNHVLLKIILLGTSLVAKGTFKLRFNAAFVCHVSVH